MNVVTPFSVIASLMTQYFFSARLLAAFLSRFGGLLCLKFKQS